jgi:hypothetical protein
MALFSSPEENAVFFSYKRSDFWLQDIKKLYGLTGSILRYGLHWDATLSKLLINYLEIARSSGSMPLLDAYFGYSSEFFSRLFYKLELENSISKDENEKLNIFLNNDFLGENEKARIPYLETPRARAILLKSLLELARLRPRSELEYFEPYRIRTIDELMTLPYHIPFPRDEDDTLAKVYYYFHMSLESNDFIENLDFMSDFLFAKLFGSSKYDRKSIVNILKDRKQWLNKDLVEAHLAEAAHCTDFEYHADVIVAACRFPSLSIAFEFVSKNGSEDKALLHFLKWYRYYCNNIHLPSPDSK